MDTPSETAGLPALNYPPELPVAAHRTEILAALRRHSVVIVCGDTGSGKTTQLPKMALELGCGRGSRRIACTQPRRLAAVTTAGRVASELGEEIGQTVGFQHRYGRRLSDRTRIKFMTDGVLLAETRNDPLLRRYDCIIVDEAHERSLNVDFLLGVLNRILRRRRDLKVIVSSATLDAGSFSAFFDNAPVVSVPGRLFPIETRYLPPRDGEELDLPRDVARAVSALPTEGDILVFLPGERDIRECADVLASARPHDDIIPLLASLPAAEQQRAFRPSPRRRIVLATNVAETSVTIPGIRAVVDSGLARISRYVHRTQVQRLQVEPISQASARQRAGRCGRVGPGICVRLYSEEDFLARDPYTAPEILRSSLAGVILTMLDLGLGDVARFPFLDPPRPGMVAEGFRELIELGAVTRNAAEEPCLTAMGRRLVALPVEPRLARMLIEASVLSRLPSVLPVVAAMSCDDPRRRPVDERERAQQAHAAFKVTGSDFLGTLKLWRWWQEQSAALSQTRLRKLCQTSYLSFPKMREWTDLVRQLERLADRLKLDTTHDDGDDAAFHRALLSGLLGRIGHWDAENRDYRGARGLRFTIHPSSVLAPRFRRAERAAARPRGETDGKPRQKSEEGIPEWIMVGELVDTSRLFGREACGIDVRWLEVAAGPLARRHCHSPEWDGRRGFVTATEQVTLYGLVIVPARRCDYSRYNPSEARDIFIRRGLIDGAFPQPPPAVRQNTALLDALRRHAEKLRKAELFDEDALAKTLDAAIPPGICSAPDLRRWLKTASRAELEAFRLRRDVWWPSERLSDADYPDEIRIGDVRMKLAYRHTPDDPDCDGLTCTVRKSQAAALRLWRADWLVPGLLPEKLMWMLSVLPTAQRKVLTPLDQTLSGLLSRLRPGDGPLDEAVVRTVREAWGFRISPEAWQRARLPDHLRVRFVILDDDNGRVLAASRELDEALRTAGVSENGASSVQLGRADAPATDWIFGDLDERASASRAGWTLEHYPALHDEGGGVTLRLFASAAEALRSHADGVVRLYLLRLGPKAAMPFPVRRLSLAAQSYLAEMRVTADALAADILAGAVRATLVDGRAPVRTAAEFAARFDAERQNLRQIQSEMTQSVAAALDAAAALLNALERDERLDPVTAESIQTQLVWLTCPGFPRTTPLAMLRRYPRYLKAASLRLERAVLSRSADRTKEARFAPWWQRYRAAAADRSEARLPPETLSRIRWLLEEFRISVFAQELKTFETVSEKRLERVFSGEEVV